MTVELPRAIRNAVRAAVSAAPGWPDWRMANLALRPDGKLPDVSQLYTAELIRAAVALNVDVANIAAQHGVALYSAELALKPTAPNEETENMTDAAPIAMTADPHANAYEGKAAADVVREALNVAEGMIGDKLFNMLVASVSPLAHAAVAGPRVVKETRTVTVAVKAPGTEGEPGSVRLVNMQGEKAARDLFGLNVSAMGNWRDVLEKPVSLWDGTHAEGVPTRDPYHVWDAEALAYLVLASRFADEGSSLRNMSRVLMYGPAGTGKTSTASQFAALTGRPFVRIAFDRSTEAAELVGQRMPKAGGGTVYHEGALVQAMQVPGCVILLDEPSFLRPGAAAVLQTILDTGTVYLKEDGNRCVTLAPGVVICAADNTNLTGDETGRYADTMAQNIALQDRFAYLVPLDYLPEAREAAVLMNRTGINLDAARAMVSFATTTRKGAATGQLTAGCSLRRLMAWATGCVAGVPSGVAFKAAVFNAADASDRETIRGLEKNTADHNRIDALVKGVPYVAPGAADAGQTVTPKGAAAASVFGAAPVTA